MLSWQWYAWFPDGHMSKTSKVNAIYTAIRERDLQSLRELSRTDEGLLYDRLRRAAWYVLFFNQKN